MNVQNVSSGINGYYMPYETKQGKGGEAEKTVCNNTAETDITSMVNGYSDFEESEIRNNIGKTWAFLKVGMGLTNVQACGVLGNIMQESGCVPDNLHDGEVKKLHDKDYSYKVADGKAYGLLQWQEQSRKAGLQNTAGEMGLKVDDINAQFAWFRYEVEKIQGLPGHGTI